MVLLIIFKSEVHVNWVEPWLRGNQNIEKVWFVNAFYLSNEIIQ